MKVLARRIIVRASEIFWAQQPVDQRAQQARLRAEIDRIKAQIADTMPDNPILKGFKVYSQSDEDGIIEYILSKIQGNKTFIEIGCADGLENNTHYLLLKGYSGYWIDGSHENIKYINEKLGTQLENSTKLKVIEKFVGTENILDLIKDACNLNNTDEPDFFSLDIDGNDLFVLEQSLRGFSPKVICVEYNAKLPPSIQSSITYNSIHTWAGDDYFGASLQMFCTLLSNYRLVCCNISGANAFFVRNDLMEPFARYSVEELFQPARYDLQYISPGHPASLKWLKNALAER